MEGSWDDPSEDGVSEGGLIGVMLRWFMGQSDEACVRERWVGASRGGGRGQTKGSGVGVPALSGADCQGCCTAVRGGMVAWHAGSNVRCRVNVDHGVSHGLV